MNTAPLSARFNTADFENEVTQVIVASDARENTRKIEEEKKREARRTRRIEERNESDIHNREIASKWGGIMGRSIPEELVKGKILTQYLKILKYIIICILLWKKEN